MTSNQKTFSVGPALYFAVMICLGVYFTYAAVQGDYGVFKRAQIEADSRELHQTLSDLEYRVAQLENKTKRLSDTYLDLDLLDEQARSILGMLRADELVIR